MEPIRLPNEKEIKAAYEEGKEAVLKLFQETFVSLAERIQELEDQLAKNSRNSGKPPSSSLSENSSSSERMSLQGDKIAKKCKKSGQNSGVMGDHLSQTEFQAR